MIARVQDVLRFIGRNAKRTAVAVVGAALVVGGLVLLVLPGPGILVVLAGLAVLATEFVWAERALSYTKDRAKGAGNVLRRKAGR